ncbi:amidohydrolase [Steroidobacter sp. S1-65]|uniref:Amidohydrolase n=1 Tax=Steroidobacter gossypii TaxID=2805490 RepID=A0ABS1X3S4_9GAMM|nr:amidohydrolase [Steroidobacter gossypii]MBM0107874.1 amidohydrolase [Steroidobacter gossypii]
MSTLEATLIQTDLVWHDPAANRRRLQERFAALDGPPDLIVLPEMFTTGFTMDASSVAEVADGPTVAWMREQAARLGAVITGSIATRQGECYFNRLIWMRPDGTHESYDKRHLFRMAHEHDHYSAGAKRLIVELKGWKILPLVCYDLRFPVWSRNRAEDAYDVLLYVANWPERRRYAWQTLIKARAIENLSYCIGVNRVGKDGNDVNYSGDSAVVDFLGQPMTAPSEQEFVASVTLDKAALEGFRNKFPAHLDADQFHLTVDR